MDANGRRPHDTEDPGGQWGRTDRPDLSPETFLITAAEDSLEAQRRARVRKYLIMMSVRVPALVIAGIVYSATGSGLLALAIVAVSIPLPWMAVLIANDRPPRKRGESPHYMYDLPHDVLGPQSLSRSGRLDERGPDRTAEDPRAAGRVIEGQVVDPRPDDN
ncbi:DUF3099 domain-containing protein [Gordonia paraffinivorans]|uniref:DUF3099 domain-containing protein n=1 Tax=Gordonia paraffinivorans TaxID=175628 RepID=UPI0014453869|nr:DUF3099 domain-containing protein [Gordonia paraffinivorans]